MSAIKDITIGFVILNYNDYETTSRFVNEIKDYDNINYILVVDNCSNDDSYIRLKALQKEHCMKWMLIKAKKNKGYAAGNNIGAKYLIKRYKPTIIGISNPDIEIDWKFIDRIKEDFMQFPEYSVITGLQLTKQKQVFYNAFWKEKNQLECFRWILRNYTIVSRIFRLKVEDTYVHDVLRGKNEIFEVGVVSGCLFFIRAEDFKKINYFDQNTFLYFEEDILASKLHRMGLKEAIDPQIKFIHYESETVNKTTKILPLLKIQYASFFYYYNMYVSKSKLDKLLVFISMKLLYAEKVLVKHMKMFAIKVINLIK